MANKITLKRLNTYEAFAGEISLGVFEMESEWNGFARLKRENGEIIVSRQDATLRALSVITGDAEDADVIRASPDFSLLILGQNMKQSSRQHP